jgi:hypothetical protein
LQNHEYDGEATRSSDDGCIRPGRDHPVQRVTVFSYNGRVWRRNEPPRRARPVVERQILSPGLTKLGNPAG